MAAPRMQHDLGGVLDLLPGQPTAWDDPTLSHWEKSVHALLVILASASPPLLTVDELRRCVEGLEAGAYNTWDYYSKWAAAISIILLERGVVTEQELHDELYGPLPPGDGASTIIFQAGDLVRIKEDDGHVRWRRPHLRCPGYVHGLVGTVERVIGVVNDASLEAYRIRGPKVPLYRVAIPMAAVWGTCYYLDDDARASKSQAAKDDAVVLEVYQTWLEIPSAALPAGDHGALAAHTHPDGHDHDHDHDHEHHDHTHEAREDVETIALAREGPDTPGRRVGDALLQLLFRKNITTPAHVARTIDALDLAGQRLLGATLVARAWTDPAFKARLLKDASAAGAELGISTSNPNAPTMLVVVENTPTVHNLVVCTLCSCYPSALLGLSPAWYRSRHYRSRAVREPRAVLREFGLQLEENVRVVVSDSTADCRYLVRS